MSINYDDIDEYVINTKYPDTYKGYKIRPFNNMFNLLMGFHLFKDNIQTPHLFKTLEEVEKYVSLFG